MAWTDEEYLPFVLGGMYDNLFFSPMIEEGVNNFVVYVIDMFQNFRKYNISTRTWTELAPPPHDGFYNPVDSGRTCYRSLALSPDGTKLATVSKNGVGLPKVIEIYTIATNTWETSADCPNLSAGGAAYLKASVWASDNNTLWVWGSNVSATFGQCVRYVHSTNTWTVFPNFINTGYFRNAAINLADTVVYAGHSPWKYTIATDNYANFVNPVASSGVPSADRLRLWYRRAVTNRLCYVTIETEAITYNAFEENTELWGYDTYGFNGITRVIGRQRQNDFPEPIIMSFGIPFRFPAIQTNPATEIT